MRTETSLTSPTDNADEKIKSAGLGLVTGLQRYTSDSIRRARAPHRSQTDDRVQSALLAVPRTNVESEDALDQTGEQERHQLNSGRAVLPERSLFNNEISCTFNYV